MVGHGPVKEKNPFPKPIRIAIGDSLDLHTFSPKEIPSLLEEYLRECAKAGIYEVRIIHGKGKGYQRKMVHAFLEKSHLVKSFHSAHPGSGGWGATIAQLHGDE